MKQIFIFWLIFWGTFVYGQENVSIQQGIALLIGNAQYVQGDDYAWRKLKNPINDVRALEKKLQELGWKVIRAENLKRDEMLSALDNLVQTAEQEKSKQVLFYFAGHGTEWEKGNYLIPINAKNSRENETINVGVPLSSSIVKLKKLKGIKLIMLDACRSQPIPDSKSGDTKSVDDKIGLADPEAKEKLPDDLVVVFAAENGKFAYDGVDENGIFASSLIKALSFDNLKEKLPNLSTIMESIEKDIQNVTNKKQNPTAYGRQTPINMFMFAKINHVSKPVNNIMSQSILMIMEESSKRAEQEAWDAIKDSKNPNALQTFIDQFPSSVFVATAKVKISELVPNANIQAKNIQAILSPVKDSAKPIALPIANVKINQVVDYPKIVNSNDYWPKCNFPGCGELLVDMVSPDNRFIRYSTGVTFDNKTGYLWRSCPVGWIYDFKGDCYKPEGDMSLRNALSLANNEMQKVSTVISNYIKNNQGIGYTKTFTPAVVKPNSALDTYWSLWNIATTEDLQTLKLNEQENDVLYSLRWAFPNFPETVIFTNSNCHIHLSPEYSMDCNSPDANSLIGHVFLVKKLPINYQEDAFKLNKNNKKLVIDCKNCPRMLKIQYSNNSDNKIFYLAETETTISEFEEFVNDTGYIGTAIKKDENAFSCNGEWKGDKNNLNYKSYPVTCVSWHDAVAYTNWLSNKTKKKYRLPTNLEWELAATSLQNIDNLKIDNESSQQNLLQKGWNIRSGEWGEVRPVKSLPPSPTGLFEMLGNAWEWTADCFDHDNIDKYDRREARHEADSFLAKWSCAPSRNYHSLKGGSVKDSPDEITTKMIGHGRTSSSYPIRGFRVLREE